MSCFVFFLMPQDLLKGKRGYLIDQRLGAHHTEVIFDQWSKHSPETTMEMPRLDGERRVESQKF